MKKSLMVFAVLAGILWGSLPAADFRKGMEAYEKEDYATALREFTALAEQGHAEARDKLGDMYHDGSGVPQDGKQAFKWYTLAAGQGHARARYKLGVMYGYGLGVPEDIEQAVKWFTLAAGQGDVDAQYLLGDIYYYGSGVPKDNIRAFMWWDIAASRGDKAAREKRDSAAEGMTPDQLETARRLAREWLEKNDTRG